MITYFFCSFIECFLDKNYCCSFLLLILYFLFALKSFLISARLYFCFISSAILYCKTYSNHFILFNYWSFLVKSMEIWILMELPFAKLNFKNLYYYCLKSILAGFKAKGFVLPSICSNCYNLLKNWILQGPLMNAFCFDYIGTFLINKYWVLQFGSEIRIFGILLLLFICERILVKQLKL